MGSIVNVALLQKKKKKEQYIEKKKIYNIFHNSWVGKFLLVLT